MHFLQFGSLSIPLHWVMAVGSILIGWIEMKILSKRYSLPAIAIDILINAFFVWGLVWKLSIILFDFPTVKGHLFAILYFSGGTKGFYLGMFFGLIYLFWKAKGENVWSSLNVLILHFGTVGYGSYFLLTSYLQEETLLSLVSITTMIILLTIWLWQQDLNQGQNDQRKAGIIFLVYAFIWHFSTDSSWVDLSIPLVFPLLSIALYAIAIKKEEI